MDDLKHISEAAASLSSTANRVVEVITGTNKSNSYVPKDLLIELGHLLDATSAIMDLTDPIQTSVACPACPWPEGWLSETKRVVNAAVIETGELYLAVAEYPRKSSAFQIPPREGLVRAAGRISLANEAIS